MSEDVVDKTFIELCEEADIIKCYGRPAFFLNDTLYFSTQTLDGESRQEIKINRDKQPKRIGKWHWNFGNVNHIIQFFKEL